ncbi:MAG: ABC transporter ATP-binding protein [Actinobacteria bacterium]|nr:ABC transporter ATP-binding protein [Actinomycetota bacterium]
MIEAIECSKAIGNKNILNNINFKVDKGNIFGYLGPNGAGKTTTIRIAMGLIKPSNGKIYVFGKDIGINNHLRQKVGILTENSGLYSNLSAPENLIYFGSLYSVKNIKDRAKKLLDFVGINYSGNQKTGTFSTGMKRKLSLAKSIINDPEVLFLDEPTAGLDPEAQKMVRELILDLAKNKEITVFLTSHNLDEVQKICDHICIINNGQVIVDDRLENLQKKYSRSVFNIKLGSKDMAVKSSHILKEKNILSEIEIAGDSINILDGQIESGEIIKMLVENNIEVKEASRLKSSLEDIYLDLVKR